MKVECPICNVYYDNRRRTPVVLPCGHSLCQNCAKSLPTRTCPTCRSSFQKYNKNYALANVIEKPRLLHDYQALFKICIVGESGVGKSSILNVFAGNEFQETTSTTIGLGFNYITEEVGGRAYKFQLWDTGGQEKYRAMTRNHYKNSHLVIVTYSLSDMDSFNEAEKYWLLQVLDHSPNSQVLLLGNKLDQQIVVPSFRIQRCQNDFRLLQSKLSCKTGEGVRQTWRLIMETLIRNHGQQQLKSSVRLQPQQQRSDDNKCPC